MIKLTKNQIDILGRPNFACAQVAKLLIASELYEDKESKAEYEQAVYIHWASDLLEKHGDAWRDEGNKILENLIDAIKLLDSVTSNT